MRRRVVVTGMGVLSPISNSLKKSWENIISGTSGITKLEGPEYLNLPCKVAAIIKENESRFDLTKYFKSSELRSISPALYAAQEALEDSRLLNIDKNNKQSVGVAVGMGMVDMNDVCVTNNALQKGYNSVSPFFVPRILQT